MRATLIVVCCTLLFACGKSQPGAPAQAQAAKPARDIDMATLPYVGKVWLAGDFGRPIGTMRIFLPNGTLVMDSCVETYRLVEWRPRPNNEIVWREDTAPIDAQIEQRSPRDLVLKIRLPREVREEKYLLAAVPYTCPDMPK